MLRDMKAKKCLTRCGGSYRELSTFDDWDGTVTCDWCGDQVSRWIERPSSNTTQTTAE